MLTAKLFLAFVAVITYPMSALIYAANEEGKCRTKLDVICYRFNRTVCLILPAATTLIALMVGATL